MNARHNDHPEDAMTRERALEEAAAYLREAALRDSNSADLYRDESRAEFIQNRAKFLRSADSRNAAAETILGMIKRNGD